jgi:hypothetical protein
MKCEIHKNNIRQYHSNRAIWVGTGRQHVVLIIGYLPEELVYTEIIYFIYHHR